MMPQIINDYKDYSFWRVVLFTYIGDLLMKKKISEEEYNITYAALKLIENLFKQGRIKQHIFKNILDDYKESIDISAFKCYT